MKSLRHPATILAGLALLVSLAGTGLAAHRYLVTSTSQISPKVLKALRGNAGPRGPQGVHGHQGAAGSARAWGSIDTAGSVMAGSTGIASVTNPVAGVYCINVPGAVSGFDVAFAGGESTNDSTVDGFPGVTTVVEVALPNGSCPGGQFTVKTFRVVPGASTSAYDEPFFFMVP